MSTLSLAASLMMAALPPLSDCPPAFEAWELLGKVAALLTPEEPEPAVERLDEDEVVPAQPDPDGELEDPIVRVTEPEPAQVHSEHKPAAPSVKPRPVSRSRAAGKGKRPRRPPPPPTTPY